MNIPNQWWQWARSRYLEIESLTVPRGEIKHYIALRDVAFDVLNGQRLDPPLRVKAGEVLPPNMSELMLVNMVETGDAKRVT